MSQKQCLKTLFSAIKRTLAGAKLTVVLIDYFIIEALCSRFRPLGEAKALKSRFDEIFASARYVAALERIRLARKELQDKFKVYHTQDNYLRMNKDGAERVSCDHENTKTVYVPIIPSLPLYE